ncbi:MAG: FAD-binding oxidoreductase [Deltaproteobacteria bacterium]|nr:FAD-binding oxidoreductase [Deltaproteobacteria bacterium]
MTPRERHPWSWGWADRFPSDEARATLADTVSAFLGIPGLAPLPLDTGSPSPAPSRVTPAADVGFEVTDDPGVRASHARGRSYPDLVLGMRGDLSGAPDLVAFPRTEDEVSAVLRWCAAQNLAVIPFGGGTSVVGGVDARCPDGYRGTVTLSLARMDALLALDTVSRQARLQAGCTGPRVEALLGAHGMTLRHFPQSFEFSTLGGWIATRAGGHFATLYTHIDDLVCAARMVTPEGVLENLRTPGNGAGPAPERLLLGSEGALGVITEAWVRVRPKPRWRLSASALFPTFEQGVGACRQVAQAGLYPSNARLLDATEALLHQVDGSGRAVLLLGFESEDHDPSAGMARALELCRAHGGECSAVKRREDDASDASSGRWREAFLDAPYLQSALVSVGLLVDTFETCVTWDRFEALHRDVEGSVNDALATVCGGGRVSCRFTHLYPDGPAPYYTFLGRARPGDELAQWEALKRAASEALLRHGATITHHHAVGRTHRPYFARQHPPLWTTTLEAVKRALDPSGVLNPGVLVPAPRRGA